MSNLHDFKVVKIELIKALYRGLVEKRGSFGHDARELLDISGLSISVPYAAKAIQSLSREDLVEWDDGKYSLTETGILLAEQRLMTDVPASDRVVSLDHNGPAVLEIISEADNLVKQLQAGNDVGTLSVDEVEVAIAEVSEISAAFKNSKVRVDATLEKTTRTLAWIGSKAAEAIIGAMALGLLALIVSFFGVA